MAASTAPEKTEKSESPQLAAPASGGGKLLVVLTALNIVLTGAMAGVLVFSMKKQSQHASIEDIALKAPSSEHKGGQGESDKKGGHGESPQGQKKSSDFGKMITLEQFTVNLSTPGSATPKYVRVNISLEVPTPDIEGEVTQKMPQVRNVVIDLFNSKRPGDLTTVEGREYLKEEIRNAINAFLVSGKVRGVFFTNFALSS
ncbi:MAG: flagellar basal body-associated FliL family protein [Bdellovibrionota bacterium]